MPADQLSGPSLFATLAKRMHLLSKALWRPTHAYRMSAKPARNFAEDFRLPVLRQSAHLHHNDAICRFRCAG
eukprot:6185555-Pleurochrysis_carterae.AAC.1